MKLHHHTAFSTVISGILYIVFKSWGLAAACFISGIFIDLDHIIDYTREHGLPFNIKKFFRVNNKAQYNKILLLWHGWEWLILWGMAAWLTDWNPWITGAFIGFSNHLVLDTFYNSLNLKSYSLLWRWRQDFDFDRIFPRMKKCKYSASNTSLMNSKNN
jgi:hypothetical protein